jgi:hypothetical protein
LDELQLGENDHGGHRPSRYVPGQGPLRVVDGSHRC